MELLKKSKFSDVSKKSTNYQIPQKKQKSRKLTEKKKD